MLVAIIFKILSCTNAIHLSTVLQLNNLSEYQLTKYFNGIFFSKKRNLQSCIVTAAGRF